ncbi:hypothetical protein MRY87_04010 [bacterium]|nr:hypothetical protein [bacterium]
MSLSLSIPCRTLSCRRSYFLNILLVITALVWLIPLGSLDCIEGTKESELSRNSSESLQKKKNPFLGLELGGPDGGLPPAKILSAILELKLLFQLPRFYHFFRSQTGSPSFLSVQLYILYHNLKIPPLHSL